MDLLFPIQDQVAKFQDDFKSVHSAANTVVDALPHWISVRSTAMKHLQETPASLGMISGATSYLGGIGSSISNSLGGGSFLKTAVNTLGHVVTLGAYDGFKKGLSDFNGRRLVGAYEELKRDAAETEYLRKITITLIDRLTTLVKDLESFKTIGESSSLLESVKSMLLSPSMRQSSLDIFNLFVGWCHQILELIQRFLAILMQSIDPTQYILEILNTMFFSPDQKLSSEKIQECTRVLNEALPVAMGLRKSFQQNTLTADSLVTQIFSGMSTTPQKTSHGVLRDPPLTHKSNSTSSGNETADIDGVFQDIHSIFSNSIDIANEVNRLLSDQRIFKKATSVKPFGFF